MCSKALKPDRRGPPREDSCGGENSYKVCERSTPWIGISRPSSERSAPPLGAWIRFIGSDSRVVGRTLWGPSALIGNSPGTGVAPGGRRADFRRFNGSTSCPNSGLRKIGHERSSDPRDSTLEGEVPPPAQFIANPMWNTPGLKPTNSGDATRNTDVVGARVETSPPKWELLSTRSPPRFPSFAPSLLFRPCHRTAATWGWI